MSATVKFWLGWASGLALLLVLAVWALLQWNLNIYSQTVADRLLLLAELRRGAMQEYFATADAELRFWSTNEDMIDAQIALQQTWSESPEVPAQVRRAYGEGNPNPAGFRLNLDDAEDGTAYSELHRRMHARTRMFVTERGYYDFFLIAPGGDVIYTVEKEVDFGTNVETGAWRDTGLGEVFRQAKRKRREGGIAISDMQAYQPSNGAPAIFMATAITDANGDFLGVIAFQLPTDIILGIMNYTSGMGDSGETYLVGQDKLMRSDSRFTDESTVLQQIVETPTVASALAGESGMSYIQDYRGVEVMSVFLPLPVGDTSWAIIAEVDRAEVQRGAARERPAMSGALLFIYGLSLWSVWYWRGRHLPQEGGGHYAGLEDFGDGGGMDG